MLVEHVQTRGLLNIVLTDADGNVKQELKTPNLIVNAGVAFFAGRMAGTENATVTHMALGSDSTAAVKANTALGAELGRAALWSSSVVTTTAANDSVQHIAIFGPGVATGPLTEAGLFTAATGGIMPCRTVFPVVNKETADTLTITWKVVFV